MSPQRVSPGEETCSCRLLHYCSAQVQLVGLQIWMTVILWAKRSMFFKLKSVCHNMLQHKAGALRDTLDRVDNADVNTGSIHNAS